VLQSSPPLQPVTSSSKSRPTPSPIKTQPLASSSKIPPPKLDVPYVSVPSSEHKVSLSLFPACILSLLTLLNCSANATLLSRIIIRSHSHRHLPCLHMPLLHNLWCRRHHIRCVWTCCMRCCCVCLVVSNSFLSLHYLTDAFLFRMGSLQCTAPSCHSAGSNQLCTGRASTRTVF
jgi:hypothetical protein